MTFNPWKWACCLSSFFSLFFCLQPYLSSGKFMCAWSLLALLQRAPDRHLVWKVGGLQITFIKQSTYVCYVLSLHRHGRQSILQWVYVCVIVVSVTVNHSGLPPILPVITIYTPSLSTHYTKTTSPTLTHNTHQSDTSWWLHNTHQSHTSSTGTHNTNEVQWHASVSHMRTRLVSRRANIMKTWLLS